MIAVTDMKVPRFAPYANGTFQMAMGLVALDLQDWIDADRNRAVELRENWSGCWPVSTMRYFEICRAARPPSAKF